ncbi:hypothetical protein MKEN_00623100 [Mycena kentingensis (nom. inval.)]|nr:hypothetical protein MKEN_00623100 [Mycena kentingensis (nom. inval.)]
MSERSPPPKRDVLVDYTDTSLPLHRRLASLGLQSAMFSSATLAIGIVCAAIPRAVEVAVKSCSRPLNLSPPGITPARFIYHGALYNSAGLALGTAFYHPARLALHQLQLRTESKIRFILGMKEMEVPMFDTAMMAFFLGFFASLPLQLSLARLPAWKGIKVDGATDFFGVGFTSVACGVASQVSFNRSSGGASVEA